MSNFFNMLLSSPLYIILFGSGGILVIIISALTIVIQKRKNSNGSITINSSENTKIENNNLNTKEIQISKSKGTVIKDNT